MVKVVLRMCLYFQFNYIAPNVWRKSAVPNYIDWNGSVGIFSNAVSPVTVSQLSQTFFTSYCRFKFQHIPK